MVGLSVHYGAEPSAYAELLSGIGLQTGQDISDVHKKYADELQHLNDLNALGYNLKTDAFQSSQASGGGQLVQGALLKDRTGKIADAYRSVVQRLIASPNIQSTGGLILPKGEGSGLCARAMQEILQKAGIFHSYPSTPDAVALNIYCNNKSNPPDHIFDKFGSTPLSKVPDGALCFWNYVAKDKNGHYDGHVAFVAQDTVGRFILGNTIGELKFRKLSGEFATVTNYYLPVSKPIGT